MKKIVLILSVLLVSVFLISCGNETTETMEEIANVDFNDIWCVKMGGASEQNVYYGIDDFTSYYKDKKYKKISGSYGNTAHTYYVCYDMYDNVLFTLVDVGNQDKVFIKEGSFDINKDFDCLYQLVD